MMEKTSGLRQHLHQSKGRQFKKGHGRPWETLGNNIRQGLERATRAKTIGDKGRQEDLRKADPPSNTGTHVGRRWKQGVVRPSEGRRMQAHHPNPTQTHMRGKNGQQGETREDKGREGKHPKQRHTHTCSNRLSELGRGVYCRAKNTNHKMTR